MFNIGVFNIGALKIYNSISRLTSAKKKNNPRISIRFFFILGTIIHLHKCRVQEFYNTIAINTL
jgi:hypothetical protein